MKDNSCVCIKNKNVNKWYCCILQCDTSYKSDLDNQWISSNKVIQTEYHTCSLDARVREKLKRRKWNFINCNAERIYILGEMKEWIKQYQSIHDLKLVSI